MANPIYRYGLDLTGLNPDNFVNNEHHVLERRKNRAIAPQNGAFFADSVVVIETATNRILTRGIHYVPVELYQSLSMATGKDIFGALLVIDRSIDANVHVSYQCVGGEHSIGAATLFSLLNKIPDDNNSYGWYDIIDKPEAFKPTPHLHPIGDAYGFEYINHQLDRIRNAILWKNIPTYNNLLNFVNNVINEINGELSFKMDSYFGPNLLLFKKQINVALYHLENIQNIEISTEEEGRIAARLDTVTNNFQRNKYVALNALVAFKNSLHTTFVSSQKTNIGKNFGLNRSPDSKSLLMMSNGTVSTIVSKNEAELASGNLNLSIYPPDVDPTHSFVLLKVTNNKDNFGGVWLMVEVQGKVAYMVTNSTGDVNEVFASRRLSLESDLNVVMNLINNHIAASSTAHKVTKAQVGLGDVENLPVVTRVEILQLENVHKYVTMDTLLLFMKTYTIGKNSSEDTTRDGTTNPLESIDIHKCNQCVADAEALIFECIPCST